MWIDITLIAGHAAGMTILALIPNFCAAIATP